MIYHVFPISDGMETMPTFMGTKVIYIYIYIYKAHKPTLTKGVTCAVSNVEYDRRSRDLNCSLDISSVPTYSDIICTVVNTEKDHRERRREGEERGDRMKRRDK